MARRRRSSARRTSTQIIRAVPMRAPSPAPIVIRQVRSAPARHHKKRGGRRHGGGGGSVEKVLVGAVIGGALLGYIEKNFGAQLPVVPLLGKKGVIAVGAYFIAKKMRVPVAYDVAKVAAGIAGYEFAQTGHVSGDELSGLAAQV